MPDPLRGREELPGRSRASIPSERQMSPPAGRITPCFGGPTFRPPDPGGESCAGDHTGPAGDGRRRVPPPGYRLTVIASTPGEVRVTSPGRLCARTRGHLPR